MTNKDLGVIIKSIQRKTKKSPDEKGILKKRISDIFHMSVRYIKAGNEKRGRRLKPLDNAICTIQYVSGMADNSSYRISLNHR